MHISIANCYRFQSFCTSFERILELDSTRVPEHLNVFLFIFSILQIHSSLKFLGQIPIAGIITLGLLCIHRIAHTALYLHCVLLHIFIMHSSHLRRFHVIFLH